MINSGSAHAHIYGTRKMHKFSSSDSFPKLRLIVSSIGTFNYNLARFLCDHLSPLVPNNYSCKDNFLLFLKLRMPIFPKKFLVFYDVTSLSPFHYSFCPPCSFLSLFFLRFSFIYYSHFDSIIYCLNYTPLLLYLVTTHLLSHPFLSSIIFIISTLIIGIFFCLDYTSLLLHLIITHLVIDFIIAM